MKKIALLMFVVFTQALAFGGGFGMFGSNWDKVSVNQTVTASCKVRELMPPEDKTNLKRLLQKYEYTEDVRIELDTQCAINEILHKYGIFEFPFSKERMREICTKTMNTPVEFVKSQPVKILDLSFMHVGSKHENWKDAFKGEKAHYCAVKANVDWQGSSFQCKNIF